MSNIVRWIGSAVIALMLVSLPGLWVASIAYKWSGFLIILFSGATAAECLTTMFLILEYTEA